MVFAIGLGRALGIAGSRWVHLLAGITWIGLLYYFNFVQTPSFATFEAGSRTEAVGKLVPRALWWFRMAAALTFVTGILILGFQDEFHADYFKTFSGMSIFAGGAYQMATIHPAAYFGLDEEIGGIGPGRRADIAVLDDLRNPAPEVVLARGEVAVRDGRVQAEFPPLDWGAYFSPRFRPTWTPQPDLFDLRVSAESGQGDTVRFPVIRLENSVITRAVPTPVPVREGRLVPPADVVRAALVDPGGRWIVRGMLGNFVARLGGLASSFNVAAQLLTLGQDSADMALAARRLLEIGGGIVVVERGETVLEIPLHTRHQPAGLRRPLDARLDREQRRKSRLGGRRSPSSRYNSVVFSPKARRPP